VTIILGGDSSNNTFFFLKEQDARNLFSFHNRINFRAAAMSGATPAIRKHKVSDPAIRNYQVNPAIKKHQVLNLAIKSPIFKPCNQEEKVRRTLLLGNSHISLNPVIRKNKKSQPSRKMK